MSLLEFFSSRHFVLLYAFVACLLLFLPWESWQADVGSSASKVADATSDIAVGDASAGILGEIAGDTVAAVQRDASSVVVVQHPFFLPSVKLNETLNIHALKFNDTLEILVPEPWLKFNPKPEFIEGVVLYLNFDDAFYLHQHFDSREVFADPQEMTVWIACMQSNMLKYSNRRLFETGLSMGINVRLMDAEQFRLTASTDSPAGSSNFQIQYDNKPIDSPDVVLSRIGSKVSHFALAVLFHLEKMGIHVLNGFEAHVTTADKLFQLQQLAQSSFPIPKSLLLGDSMGRHDDKLKILSTEFQFPVIVKKLRGLQGRGIMLVKDLDHFNDLEQIMDDRQPYLIQEYISLSHGRDIRIFVVGGKIVGSMMRVAREGFKSNFHLGGFVKQVKLNERLEWLAIEASNHLGLDLAGVDILIGNGTYQICEVNSSPGFMGLENATGLDIASKILTWITIKTNSFRK